MTSQSQAGNPADKPGVSFVVEWENALNSESSRAVSMLIALKQQASELVIGAGYFELLLVYDSAEFNEAELTAMMKEAAGPPDEILNWRLLHTTSSGYYENKNLGARQSHGEIIIFIDPDVIPEPGWLKSMLTTLENKQSMIVVGNTYIEPSGLIGKAFALTWFFPMRAKDGPVLQVQSFFANNLAIKRKIFNQHPFPELKGTSRGACLVLAKQLAEAGIPVHWNPVVRVSHPAPNGRNHFKNRALAQGRDRLSRERLYGIRWSRSWPASCIRLVRHCGGSALKVIANFRQVNLNPLMIPAVISISWAYYFVYWIGETAHHLGSSAILKVRV